MEKTLEIEGTLFFQEDTDLDEAWDKIIEFLESKGWSFLGMTKEVEE